MDGFWIFMLIVTLLLPFTMIRFGNRFTDRAPREINWVFGYRSARSMKNRETWDFAHRYVGRLWSRLGSILLIPTVIVMVLFRKSGADVVGTAGGIIVVVQLVPMIVSLVLTEQALKREFDEFGRSRKNTAFADENEEK